jgi:hypothetical protein
MFSRSAGRVELANAGQPFGAFWEELQSHAVATVLTAIAGLEAYANELFVDHPQVFPNIRADVMGKLWELYEQKATIDKYEFALFLLQASRLDRGANPFQDVKALIALRNALVHYKPEWSDEQVEHAKISKLLAGRAAASPFFLTTEPLFPRAWASHGSTRWAVSSVVAFIQTFETQARLASRLQPFLQRLTQL